MSAEIFLNKSNFSSNVDDEDDALGEAGGGAIGDGGGVGVTAE